MQQMGSDAADGQWYFDDSSAGGKCVAEQEIDQPWKRLTDTPHIISSHHLLIISSSHLQEHFGCFECARTFADGGAGGAPLKAYSFESNPYCEEHYRSRIAKQV
jgi:hypothetical protein